MAIDFRLELRQAWRRLLRARGFGFSVIVLMALSVGGVAAVASAAWSLFLQPLPYVNAERLVTLSAYSERFGVDMGYSAALAEELNATGEFGQIGLVDIPKDERMEDSTSLRAVKIDHRVMNVLGVQAELGRTFIRDDTQPGAETVALLSNRLWLDRYAASKDVIGQRLQLESGAATIVGVMPQRLALPEAAVQVWLPMQIGPDQLTDEMFSGIGSLLWVARAPQQESLLVYGQRLEARIDRDERMQMISKMLELSFRWRPLREHWAADQTQAMAILAAATIVVLLAAWLNLAGLWLARWSGRDHLLALQLALGSGTWRVLTGILLEYLLLLLPGVLLSVLVAGGAIELMYALEVLGENGPLRAAVAAPTLLTVLLLFVLGMVPVAAIMLRRLRHLAAATANHLSGQGIAAIGASAGLQRLLVIGQIAIACSLLITLGLLMSSWHNLLQEDLGLDKKRLLAAQIVSDEPGEYGPDPVLAALLEELQATPGVEAVSWSTAVPFGRIEMLSSVHLDGLENEQLPARNRIVGSDFFLTAGIRLLEGRDFGPEDIGHGIAHAIVDQAFEDMYLGGDALGQKFKMSNGPENSIEYRIIGVVESVRHMSPEEAMRHPTVYSYGRTPFEQTQLLLRSFIPPNELQRDIRRLLENELGVERVDFVSSLESLVRFTQRDREPQLILLAVFSGLALLLLFYGLYALASYQVNRRGVELGLRKALGASRQRIIAEELLRALHMLPLGLMLGALGAYVGVRLIESQLYRVSLAEPQLWLLTIAGVSMTIVTASLLPAMRAARQSPMLSLRSE